MAAYTMSLVSECMLKKDLSYALTFVQPAIPHGDMTLERLSKMHFEVFCSEFSKSRSNIQSIGSSASQMLNGCSSAVKLWYWYSYKNKLQD